MSRRIDADIVDDVLAIRARVDPETLDPDALADDLADAIARALESWRDGQRAAIAYDAERQAAHERRIWDPARWTR